MTFIDDWIERGESFENIAMRIGMERLYDNIDSSIGTVSNIVDNLESQPVIAPINSEVNITSIQTDKAPEITAEATPVAHEVTTEVEIPTARRPRHLTPVIPNDNDDEEQGRQERLQAAEEETLKAYDDYSDKGIAA